MSPWANLVGYQLVWLLLVRGAAERQLAPAMLAAALFVIWQLLAAAQPWVELRLVGLAMALGLLVDGVAAAGGWLRYASAEPALPSHGAPLWIVLLWACFATTVNHSLRALRRWPWLAALLGAVGAPMAYLAAARGWQAVSLTPVTGVLWIGAGWAVALPLLCRQGLRWSHLQPGRPS